MTKETEMLNERIESYMEVNGIELTDDEAQGVFNGVQFWLRYTIDDVIADAITGVTYVDVT